MADEDRGHAGAVLVAFVLGAIAGAAVALLWAPAPGLETRRRLGERAREGRDKAADAARQGREFLRSQRENLSSALERGKEAFGQARGSAPRGGAPRDDAPRDDAPRDDAPRDDKEPT